MSYFVSIARPNAQLNRIFLEEKTSSAKAEEERSKFCAAELGQLEALFRSVTHWMDHWEANSSS